AERLHQLLVPRARVYIEQAGGGCRGCARMHRTPEQLGVEKIAERDEPARRVPDVRPAGSEPREFCRPVARMDLTAGPVVHRHRARSGTATGSTRRDSHPAASAERVSRQPRISVSGRPRSSRGSRLWPKQEPPTASYDCPAVASSIAARTNATMRAGSVSP